ncbi:MAG: hypothetical protein JXR70_04400 [Spirochaetales bacterium]|nr:hypothetical protein [Spirochaetales bacterium]
MNNKQSDNWEIFKNAMIILMILLCLGFILFLIIKTAWLSDDSFITFRTVDNFINGHGLTWNTNERVQAYTHPLWMFVLSFFYYFTHEIFYTAIFISIGLSVLSCLVYGFGVSLEPVNAIIGLLFLSFSKSFIEYSTSGLENPLTFMLMALFYWVYFKQDKGLIKLFLLALISSLSAINRSDTILFFIFPIILSYYESKKWISGIMVLFIGILPFMAWEVFSVYYYGFPFPNTAYAKLNTGVSSLRLAQQGLNYYVNSIKNDPITLLGISVGIVSFFINRKKRVLFSSLGIILYLLYIIKIGGDFMSGRFFAAPLFASMMNLSQSEGRLHGRITLPAAICIIYLGLLTPSSPVNLNQNYSNNELKKEEGWVADERGWYYLCTGLLQAGKRPFMPSCGYSYDGIKFREQGPQTIVHGFVGMVGYFAGPDVHIIDFNALTDPLLSRIHIKYPDYFRIGHFARDIPEGYKESIALKANLFKDKRLALFYEKLKTIISGPLNNPERLPLIIDMNLGKYNYLLNSYYSKAVTIRKKDIPESSHLNLLYDDPKVITFPKQGLIINLDTTYSAGNIELSLDSNDIYKIDFCDKNKVIFTKWIPVNSRDGKGTTAHNISLKNTSYLKGYNQIRIYGFEGDGIFTIGHLKILKENQLSSSDS